MALPPRLTHRAASTSQHPLGVFRCIWNVHAQRTPVSLKDPTPLFERDRHPRARRARAYRLNATLAFLRQLDVKQHDALVLADSMRKAYFLSAPTKGRRP